MEFLLSCYKCGELVIKDTGTEAKIRSRVLIIKGDAVIAACKGCGTEIAVPLKLDNDMMKSLRNNPRLFIAKKDK